MRTLILATAAVAALAATPAAAQSLKVVATTSILADMTANVAGDRAEVTALVGPDSDPHVFRPTPVAAGRLAEADVVVVNGLGLEGWMDRLVESSGFGGALVVASRDVAPLAGEEHGAHAGHDDAHEGDHAAHHDEDEAGEEEHAAHHHEAEAGEEGHAAHHHEEEHGDAGHDHGAYDPHAWQSLANAHHYVEAIADGLIAADPDGADAYRANRDAYLAKLDALDAEVKARFAAIPAASRTIITSHDAFGYFGDEYGLTFVSPVGYSTEAEASAQDMAALIRQIRSGGVAAVFFESGADPRMLQQIASETDATIGGTLYAGALSGPDGPAPTYLDMMRHNADTIAAAIRSDS